MVWFVIIFVYRVVGRQIHFRFLKLEAASHRWMIYDRLHSLWSCLLS